MKVLGKIFAILFCLTFSFIGCLQPFGKDIAIYGDSEHNPKIQRKLIQTILSFKPTIIFRVGDMVENYNDPELLKTANDIRKPLLKTQEYFTALGNHESEAPELYFKNFPLLQNRRWYSVDRLGIHFIILDSSSKLKLESEQYKWLESDLAATDSLAKFTVVIFHHPLFDVSEVHKSDEKRLKIVLLPLFQRYRISAVFSGHSHDYQRYEYGGMYFIVTGGGGSNLYSQSREDPYLQKFSLKYHFCFLTPETGFLRVRVIDIGSNIIDDFKIPARVGKYSL